ACANAAGAASASSGARTSASSVLRMGPAAPWTTPALSLVANSDATTSWPSSLFQTLLWILFMCNGLLAKEDEKEAEMGGGAGSVPGSGHSGTAACAPGGE